MIDLFIIVFVSLLGPIFASFFAAQIVRETGLTRAEGSRSQCDHCHKDLRWWELIPIFSYIYLRGKCLRCGGRIPLRSLLGEVYSAFIYGIFAFFLLRTLVYPIEVGIVSIVVVVVHFIALTSLLYLSIYDLFTFSIPSLVTKWIVVYAVGINVLFLIGGLIDPIKFGGFQLGVLGNLIAGILGGAFIFGLMKLTKNKGIGEGDMYLAVIVGLLTSWPGIVAAFYGMVFPAAGLGIVYAIMKGRYKGLLVPLVPFITLGYVLAITWGNEIINALFIRVGL